MRVVISHSTSGIRRREYLNGNIYYKINTSARSNLTPVYGILLITMIFILFFPIFYWLVGMLLVSWSGLVEEDAVKVFHYNDFQVSSSFLM